MHMTSHPTDSAGLQSSCAFRITITDDPLVIPSYDAVISSPSSTVTVVFGCPAQPISIDWNPILHERETRRHPLVQTNCTIAQDVLFPRVRVLRPLGTMSNTSTGRYAARSVVVLLRDVPEGATCNVAFLPMESGPCFRPARFYTHRGVAVIASKANNDSDSGGYIKESGTALLAWSCVLMHPCLPACSSHSSMNNVAVVFLFRSRVPAASLLSYDVVDDTYLNSTAKSYKWVAHNTSSGLWWHENVDMASRALLAFARRAPTSASLVMVSRDMPHTTVHRRAAHEQCRFAACMS
jgi:hypothetical protein